MRIARDDNIESWNTPVGGARAFAIGDGRAALYGGYRDDKHRCVVLEFEGAELVERARIQLTLTSGVPLAAQPVLGRDSFLHVFDGPCWYRFDIRTLAGV